MQNNKGKLIPIRFLPVSLRGELLSKKINDVLCGGGGHREHWVGGGHVVVDGRWMHVDGRVVMYFVDGSIIFIMHLQPSSGE